MVTDGAPACAINLRQVAPPTCGIKGNGRDKRHPLVGKTGCEPDVTHTVKWCGKLWILSIIIQATVVKVSTTYLAKQTDKSL